MAGIVVPTVFLLFAVSGSTIVRSAYYVPAQLERVIIFPMAFVPNLWGVWNMLYLAVGGERRWPIGVHGAVLPLVLIALGYVLAQVLAIDFITSGSGRHGRAVRDRGVLPLLEASDRILQRGARNCVVVGRQSRLLLTID